MQPPNNTCPLCHRTVEAQNNVGNRTTLYSCEACGDFAITLELKQEFETAVHSGHLANYLPYRSAATRHAYTSSGPITLTTENWRQLAETHRAIPISAKLERLLRYIGDRSGIPGGSCEMATEVDYPLFSAATGKELTFYLTYLEKEEKLVRGPHVVNRTDYSPTMKGWQRLESIPPVGGEPDRCFVAMWFSDDLDSVYERGIAEAIRECGFKPDRVKEDPTNKAIIDRVLAGIRRAHFVVADFTGQRPSVYYEAGFARGIAREVIGCCREDQADKIAFDTRHLGHVIWKDEADLKTKLIESIQANIIPKR